MGCGVLRIVIRAAQKSACILLCETEAACRYKYSVSLLEMFFFARSRILGGCVIA